MRYVASSLLPFLLAAAAAPAAAEDAPRQVAAARAVQVPVIDGRIEPSAWSVAPEISALRQQRPDNGAAASESTQVWILYDDDALYVAARCHDRAPITRLLGRRDTFLESDWFGILLDPQHDRRSGNAFFVNPDGVQYDEVISNDLEEDTSWDGVWQSAASIDPAGWSAEMRIPFSQLRFAEREEQTWGINMIRWIKRRQEQARLVSHPRDVHGFVSRFGDLVALRGVRPRPKAELTPYFTSSMTSARTVAASDPLNQRTTGSLSGGADLRWTGRSNLTIGATLHPDFGQVEVDPAILNLSQFEQFFPEKRPFFLEGAKVYTFGDLTATYFSPFRLPHPLIFYSRRIGRVPQGNARLSGQWLDAPDETSILGAGKLVHRSAGGASVALLDAVTAGERASFSESGGPEEQRLVEPLTNHFAGRWTRDFSERSRLGALVTGVARRSEASTAFLSDRAFVAGLDAYGWLGRREVLVDFILAGSDVRGGTTAIGGLQRAAAHQYQRPDADHLDYDPGRRSLSGWGGKIAVSRESGTWRYQVLGESWSPGFEVNDLGFQQRADVRAGHLMGTWFDVVKRRHTRNIRVSLGRYGQWTQGGEVIGDGFAADATTTFTNYWTATVQGAWVRPSLDDREARGGPAIARPEGWTGSLRIATDPRRRLSADLLRTEGADEDGGQQRSMRATLTLRPRSNLSLALVGTVTDNVVASKWVASVADPSAAATGGTRHVFARLEERRLELAPRVDWTMRRNLTLQLYLQPFAASGSYTGLKELLASAGPYREYGSGGSTIARASDPREYGIDPDGAGPADPFVVRDPDFRLRSLRGNAVLRWELDGATTLYLVWNQQRALREATTSDDRWYDLRAIGDVAADDHIRLKISHRFDLPR